MAGSSGRQGVTNIKLCSSNSSHCLWFLAFVAFNVVDALNSGNNNSRALLYNTQRNIHANISELLDNLLRGYDNSVRPDFGGPPAVVEVDIMVRSMGPISEVDMTYSMDCYFRQSWVDRRLAFKGAQDTLALSISMLARIWKPDTYFYNGKQSYLHTITTPNKFVRLHQDGRVLYSSRLTIKAGCPMRLENFPMDVQQCPLKFGSFGYTTHDVLYRWNPSRQVAIAEDMKLSQFDLVDCPAGNTTDRVIHQISEPQQQQQQRRQRQKQKPYNVEYEYSMLVVSFHLQRHMGNFLIQVYGPCILLVVLSWVSFWLNREATADRVSLGITTVLTMTFLGLEARTDLPKVSYPTALDFFVFLSFAFIFATILQFAFVHYFTKYGSGECYFTAEEIYSGSDSDIDDEGGEEEEECEEEECIEEEEVDADILEAMRRSRVRNQQQMNVDAQLYEVIPLSVCSVGSLSPTKHPTTCSLWDFFCMRPNNKTHADITPIRSGPSLISGMNNTTSFSRKSFSALRSHQNGHKRQQQQQKAHRNRRRRRRRQMPRFNSVSKIDRASRVLFPLTFLVINLFYWYSYLYSNAREELLLFTK